MAWDEVGEGEIKEQFSALLARYSVFEELSRSKGRNLERLPGCRAAFLSLLPFSGFKYAKPH